MWIIRWLFIAIIVLGVIGFAMQNMAQTASIQFIKWETIPLPLWVIMYASFAFGILFWLLISIVQIFGLKNENRKSRKEVKRLKTELDKLRNVSIDDSIIPVESRPPESGDEQES
jgi:uncharacterized integral membrane protein